MTSTVTSPIVSLTLWLLLLFSVVTWSIVVRKGWLQLQLSRLNQQFHQHFWKAPDLTHAESLATSTDGPLARLASAGFGALNDLRNPGAHTLLHSAIGEVAAMPLLREMTDRALSRWERLRRHYFQGVLVPRVEQAQREHRELLAALVARDPDEAERVVRAHNRNAQAAYSVFLQQQAPGQA